MPLPLTVSCFSKIPLGFTFLVLAHPGSPGKRAVKRVCVCVYVCVGREMLPKVPFHLAGYRPLANTRFLGPPADQFSHFSTADGCDQQADRQRSEHTHTCPFNGPLSGTTWVCQYQKGKTNLDLTATRDNEWQWHQLGHMQVCTSLQTDNHASTTTLSLLRAGCPSCHPTNSVNALNIRKI